MIEILRSTFYTLLEATKLTTYRYLYSQFNTNNRLTGIIGPRGVGKTTLILQYIKNNWTSFDAVLYFSADHLYFSKTTLLEFVHETHLQDKVQYYFIDEIHKYKNWNQELKNIYDSYPNVKVIFSGSSSIDLVKGTYDLSRRVKLYHLEGLSLREYLNFKNNKNYEPIVFADMLKDYNKLDPKLSLIEGIKRDFIEYLKYGYYPFVFEDKSSYYEKINRIIEKTIYEDIADFYKLKTENLYHFKRILNYLSTIPPRKINTHNLAKNLGINDQTAFEYLKILGESGLSRLMYPKASGNQILRKPEKVFLNNTTLHYAINEQLAQDVEIGSIRELFFIQALQNAGVKVFYSSVGDYEVSDVIFEIGGKNKKNKQIRSAEHGFLVQDDILMSKPNILPLYYLGFCY